MKMGDDVWFIVNHKLMQGVLLRNYKNTSTIKCQDKIYKVNYCQVSLKKGVGNARTGLSVCCNNAGDGGCNGEKNRGIQSTIKRETKSSKIPKGVWKV